MDIKERILVALGLEKPEQEIKLGWQSKSEDGTIFVSTAEELESGVDISVLTEDGTTIPLPKGTYKTQDGVSFRVEDEGIVSEVMESETEEEIEAEDEDKDEKDEKEEMAKKDEDEDEDEDKEEDMRKKEDEYESEEMPDWYKKTYEEMKDKVDNLMDAIADLKSKMGVKDEDVKMKEEVKELSSDEEISKLKEENDKLKTELSESPADAPINTNKFSSDRKPLTRKEYNKLSKQERFLYNLGK